MVLRRRRRKLNEDVQRHSEEAIESIALWKKHKKDISIAASGNDLQENVTSGINSYGFVFAARYHLWLIEKYLKTPSKYYPDTNSYMKAKELVSELNKLESESWVLWDIAATKIKDSLPKKEWKKYLEHLDATNGSSKYAVDLGLI
jgi:hypothetical protein